MNVRGKKMLVVRRILWRRNLIHGLKCCAKVATFIFWASLCLATMKLALFKKNSTPEVKDWIVPDNYTKWLILLRNGFNVICNKIYLFASTVLVGVVKLNGPVIGEDYPEPDYQFELDSDVYNAIKKNLTERAWTVSQVCQKYRLTNQPINSKEFFIAYKYYFVWCNIFKAASSSWMHKLNILGGYRKAFLSKTRTSPMTLAREIYPRPNSSAVLEAVSDPEMVSLLIVREPFVRLLSAYRDKLEKFVPPYYRNLAQSIVKKYRQKAIKHFGPITSHGPTFYEFVLYLIDNSEQVINLRLDEHWAPYYTFCSPCAVNFSVIAKVETMHRDSAYVMKTLGLEGLVGPEAIVTDRRTRLHKILNKSKDGRNTTSLLKSYFSQLDENMLNDLLKIYGIDFEMFGYDSNVYRNYIRQKLYT